MSQVTVVLLYDSGILLLNRSEIFTLVEQPFFEIFHNDFEVGNRHFSCAEMIVSQIFGLICRVVSSGELLCSESVHGIVLFLFDPLIQCRDFVFRCFCIGYETISPVDSVNVIDAENGRREPYSSFVVAGLCHEVVTGIVHDTGRGSVFLRERRTAQRVDREGVAGPHIVHQSQCMTYFVRSDVA